VRTVILQSEGAFPHSLIYSEAPPPLPLLHQLFPSLSTLLLRSRSTELPFEIQSTLEETGRELKEFKELTSLPCLDENTAPSGIEALCKALSHLRSLDPRHCSLLLSLRGVNDDSASSPLRPLSHLSALKHLVLPRTRDPSPTLHSLSLHPPPLLSSLGIPTYDFSEKIFSPLSSLLTVQTVYLSEVAWRRRGELEDVHPHVKQWKKLPEVSIQEEEGE